MKYPAITILFFLLLHHTAFSDEVLEKMSLEEKIGQLFIAGVYSNREDAEKEGLKEDPISYIERLIQKHHIGGILFKMRWSPHQVHCHSTRFQRLSKYPLFTAIDAEWGLAMRMASAPLLPKNQALGEVQDDTLIFEMGKEIGRELRLIGINWNFSPVVDIYSNPENPIIHDRAFGTDPEKVARLAKLMIQGLQQSGVLATAKHFPGHGSAAIDSHTGLPVIQRTKSELFAFELHPFRAAIDCGVLSIMCAHLLIPALDPELPTSLSQLAIEKILKEEMGFQGLVVTDDLLMEAVSKQYSPEERACLAFLAGNDLILSSRDIEPSVRAIKEAVLEGRILREEIDKRVLKILNAKRWIAENGQAPPAILKDDELFSPETFRLKEKLFRSSVHVYRDPPQMLPLGSKELVYFVEIGGGGAGLLYQFMVEKMDACHHRLPKSPGENERRMVYQTFHNNAPVVIAIRGMNRSFHDGFGVSQETYLLIDELVQQDKQVVVIVCGSPAVAEKINGKAAIIAAYEEDCDADLRSIELLFGNEKEELSEGKPLPKERLTL